MEEHLGFQKSGQFRKKYNKRSFALEEDDFKSYITQVTAYLSIKFAEDPKIKDFLISVNDEEWKSFGDIVIKLFQEDKNSLYAIKCKEVLNSYKQIESLNQVRISLEEEYAVLNSIKRNADFGIATFSIFTSANATPKFIETTKENIELSARTLNQWKTSEVIIQCLKENIPINVTSNQENVFLFELPTEYQVTLPKNLLFFTNQFFFGINSYLNDLLKNKFKNNINISKDFTQYIKNWIDGKLGGSFKLGKKDVVLKLGQMLLSPFTIYPNISLKQDNYDAWNRILDLVDLTIIKNEPFIMNKLSEPINQIIENIFGIKINTISKTVHIKDKIDDNTDPALKAYLFEEINNLNKDIQVVKIYMVLWKYGKVPLLLSSEQKEGSKGFIQDVIGFMKQNGVKRKFILKTSDPQRRPKDKIKIFSCLEDVKYLVDLNHISINYIGPSKLSLQTISETDPLFLKWVTPGIFFDIILNKYIFKKSLPQNNGQQTQQALNIILKNEDKELLSSKLYGSVPSVPNEEENGIIPSVANVEDNGSTSSIPNVENNGRITTAANVEDNATITIHNKNVGKLKGVDRWLF